MSTTQLIEPRRAGEFLLSEGNGDISREQIVLAAGQNLKPGTPLGKVLLGGAAAASAAGGGNTGNGTLGTFTVTSAAKIGAYTVTCTAAAANGGTFRVLDPDGVNLGNATVGTPFSKNGLTFTIADGATDFIVGDSFTVTVTPAVGAADAGNTGNGAIGTVAVSTGAKAGVYRVVMIEPGTNVGTFLVIDPDGVEIGEGVVATQFSAGGLTFTIADGSTDFVSGDSFTITVTAGSGQYRAVSPTAKDGSQIGAAILYRGVDATEAAKKAVAVVRQAEYNEDLLEWPDGLSDNQKATVKADLAKAGIIARNSVGDAELSRD